MLIVPFVQDYMNKISMWNQNYAPNKRLHKRSYSNLPRKSCNIAIESHIGKHRLKRGGEDDDHSVNGRLQHVSTWYITPHQLIVVAIMYLFPVMWRRMWWNEEIKISYQTINYNLFTTWKWSAWWHSKYKWIRNR